MLKAIHTEHAPEAIGPYSQAISVGGFVFVSGQIPIDPATGKLIQGSIGQQADRVLSNLRAILEAAGSSMGKVIKTTIYLASMSDFTEVNDVYARAFGDHRPARATVAAAALPKGAAVEIEAVATV